MLAVIPGCAIARLDVPDPDAALQQLAARLERCGAVTASFEAAVRARERAYPTGLATLVPTAIPHTDPEHVLRPGFAVASLARPVPFGAMGASSGSSVAVELVVMLVLGEAGEHLGALQRLMACLRRPDAMRDLLRASSDEVLEHRASAWLAG